jgi:acyl-homoserine-lactone acylase
MRMHGSSAKMKKFLFVLSLACAFCAPTHAQTGEAGRWEQEARNVTIIRDNWGIAHVYGKTDADAVFGMVYAQAEDDFNRVETNYINAMGRLAEAEGESKIYQDLRMKLFIDPQQMRLLYVQSPPWLKAVMVAFADSLNYYLFKHHEVKPRVIHHFEPWMALAFTEGSIGGDIERVDLNQLAAFYGKAHPADSVPPDPEHEDGPDAGEPTGSNGVAIAPSNTVDHHALLLINPHTSFYFRSELQMVSDQGLDAYGAVTWGQFFIYQGFNDRIGWMHTSSGVDAVDEYLETVLKKDDRYFYKYGSEERLVEQKEIVVPYKTDHGMAERKFTVYRTHHGPVIADQNGKWVTISLMQKPIIALQQSYLRTKATGFKSFRQTMELQADSSNNTILADADGNIAYFHANFIPKRDTHFDFTKPVDGSNPATDWHSTLAIDETPHLINPKSGWVYNSNDAPWSAGGPGSLKKEDYPAYVEKGGESARGRHAVRVLQGNQDFTLDSLIAAAFDSYLTWFDKSLPALIEAWDNAPSENPLKVKLREQISVLRAWDHRWSVDSVATALAVFWAEDVRHNFGADARKAGMPLEDYVALRAAPARLLQSLSNASDKLIADFGAWKTPWGDINRFQRMNDDIVPQFSDAAPSIPVGFTSGTWGSLASFGARAYPGTKKWYGTSGNSFVAVVEFGPSVHARAVTAGGESGNPSSPHFDDEAQRYATGNLREVYFYRSQLQGHIERQYHPGQ